MEWKFKKATNERDEWLNKVQSGGWGKMTMMWCKKRFAKFIAKPSLLYIVVLYWLGKMSQTCHSWLSKHFESDIAKVGGRKAA